MISVAYSSPFVPPEWIAAHGLQPRLLNPYEADRASEAAGRRGVCPYAGAVIDAAARPRCQELVSSARLPCGEPPGPKKVPDTLAGVVFATTCDQMRYAASVLEHRGHLPVFLMNVPSTWQSATARSLYREELGRLGRFLVRLGGMPPAHEELAQVMSRFDFARAQVRQTCSRLSARQMAEALQTVREEADLESIASWPWAIHELSPLPLGEETGVAAFSPRFAPNEMSRVNSIPLALVGGPLVPRDYDLLDWIENAGGRIVLDASEWGERTLPRPFDSQQRLSHPFEELVGAYFGGIPDAFRRPNDPCHEYLAREMAARGVSGVIFRRYLWCDLWHAELPRLKAMSPVPVLDLDVTQSEPSAEGRTLGRVEAFLEMIRASEEGVEKEMNSEY